MYVLPLSPQPRIFVLGPSPGSHVPSWFVLSLYLSPFLTSVPPLTDSGSVSLLRPPRRGTFRAINMSICPSSPPGLRVRWEVRGPSPCSFGRDGYPLGYPATLPTGSSQPVRDRTFGTNHRPFVTSPGLPSPSVRPRVETPRADGGKEGRVEDGSRPSYPLPPRPRVPLLDRGRPQNLFD